MPPKIARIKQILSKSGTNRTVEATYGGVTVSDAVKGGVSKDADYQIQGYREEYNFSIWVEADAWTPLPRTGRGMTVDSELRRVLGVFPDSLGALVRVDLGAKYAGN